MCRFYPTCAIKNLNYDVDFWVDYTIRRRSKRIGAPLLAYYWNVCQQLAHHTVNGCNVKVGDIMASGTISGTARDNAGCLLEQTKNGQEPIKLKNGTLRHYLQDGDQVIMTGFAGKEGYRVGFGRLVGKVSRRKVDLATDTGYELYA